MRVFIFSSMNVKNVKKLLLRNGFVVSKYKPDFIVSYGGDGTTLSAERKYPGIPKLIVKTSKVTHSYEITENELQAALKKIKKGKYKIVEETKVVGIFRSKKLIGLNEVQVHTKTPMRALGFSVYFGETSIENLIGDGVLVATPFGSTGYYNSLGGKPFKRGLGIGFNNIHNRKVPCRHLKQKTTITIKIIKGKGILAADNNPKVYLLNPGDEVKIEEFGEKAKFIKVL